MYSKSSELIFDALSPNIRTPIRTDLMVVARTYSDGKYCEYDVKLEPGPQPERFIQLQNSICSFFN
jgi:hypothetical protein